jgi:triosephosphate isomerase
MFIAANWKMNLNKKEIYDFIKNIEDFKFYKNVEACIFPSSLFIDYVATLIKNLPIFLGGQSCHYNQNGAFTGEISPVSLKLLGCNYVLLGHSERRINNNENNDYVRKCSFSAVNANLIPIICVGESLETRKNGNALDYIKNQVHECLPQNYEQAYIAYEPVWSIGTGHIPNNSEIEEMHTLIKNEVKKLKNKSVKVLYGGSVNPKNAKEIMSIKNVDGTLVGGASLNIKDFLAIYTSAVKQ